MRLAPSLPDVNAYVELPCPGSEVPPCLRAFLTPDFCPACRFGIGVFYTMLYQLFLALFNDSTLLKNVSEGDCCARGRCKGGKVAAEQWQSEGQDVLLAPPAPTLPVLRTSASVPPPPPPQIGSILSMIYLFLIIVQVIVNLKNKPEAVEKVGGGVGGQTGHGWAMAAVEISDEGQGGGCPGCQRMQARLGSLRRAATRRKVPIHQPISSITARLPAHAPHITRHQVHLFCAVFFMLYMVAFTGITIW